MQKINNKKVFLSLIILLAVFSSAILIKNIAILKKQTDLNDTTKLTKEIFAMDTIMSLTAYTSANDVLNLCEEKIIELENLFSTTNDNSEISILNQKGENTLSQDTFNLIEESLKICNLTNGALDISVYPIVKSWGFTTETPNVPSLEEINYLLQYVNYKNITLSKNNNTIKLNNNMAIDLGSTAKGYTSNTLINILKEHNVKSALLNLGGNVHALGSKPDGTPWKIAIKTPLTNSNAAVISIVNKAVITSGAYERYFIDDNGVKYGHIIDPNTGMPINNELLSVSIIGKDAVLCDALSTSLFVMGLEKSIEYWKKNNDFDAVFITKDGHIYITEGIEDDITLLDDFSNISPNIIKNENKKNSYIYFINYLFNTFLYKFYID